MLCVNEAEKRIDELCRHAAATPRAFCFDFFDTLVTRTIEPEHTKRLAARRLSLLLGGEPDCETIYAARREIEADLCRENIEAGRDSEFSFAAMGRRLFTSLSLANLPFFASSGDEAFHELLLDIEVAVEKSVQRLCGPTVQLVRALKDKGFPVCLVSDFYLPEERFRELLLYHGIDGLFDHLFVSADHGLTKGGGRLYDIVAQRLGLSPGQLCMVGDNEHSDIRMACDRGMAACRVDASVQREYYRRWRQQQEDRQQNTRALEREFARIIRQQGGGVFPELGLALWRFLVGLLAALARDGCRHVFFCSKEGEFMKRLFDRMQEELFGGPVFTTHYLLVSRKATFVGSLRPLPEEDFARFFSQYPVTSPLEFLLSLNFDREKAKQLCRDLCLEPHRRIAHLNHSRPFMELVCSRAFAAHYEKLRYSQQEGFRRYLDAFHVPVAEEGLRLVDVGWKGSIQDNIYFLLDGKVAVRGYYLGLHLPDHYSNPDSERNRKQGILFSNHSGATPYFSVFDDNRSLFEMALGASHGSADGYFIPGPDGQGGQSADGPAWRFFGHGDQAVAVRLLDLPEERRLYRERIEPLQRRLMRVIDLLTGSYLATTAPMPSPRWFAGRHGRMVFFPTPGEIGCYQSLYHLENFGIHCFTRFGPEGKHGLRERLGRGLAVLREPGKHLDNGTWPPVTLRRMGLGGLIYLDGLRRWRRAFGRRAA